MCGRYVLKRKDLEALLQHFGIRSLEEFHSRYNIAPTTIVPAIRTSAEGGREAVPLRWGLVPSWAKDPAGGARLCNARAEGIAAKPAFRHAFRKKRCLVPASGFYEWQTLGRTKLPWYFSRRDEQPFVFAGLWESWRSPAGTELETCSLITTDANPVVGQIHDRMPVILAGSGVEEWINPEHEEPEKLLPLLRPFPAEEMSGRPVNPQVNSVATEGPECLEPAPVLPAPGSEGPQLSLGFE
ncbi:MAG: SOS response-associated peptidase [Opitutaceae bacterium]|nr:SOS response-associated peptidase [Opitutaceae bacterium]